MRSSGSEELWATFAELHGLRVDEFLDDKEFRARLERRLALVKRIQELLAEWERDLERRRRE